MTTIQFSENREKCPICAGKLYRIEDADFVCKKHENYLLTTCSICGRMCFSTTIRLCHSCGSPSRNKTYRKKAEWIYTA